MRTTKRRLFFWEPYEKETLARLLEEEAAKGWRLTGISVLWMVFTRSAPEQVRYSVVLDDSADGYDFQPGEQTREYIDYCAAAGWEYVCGQGKWRIFRTSDPDAPPIESDPVPELEAIHVLCRRSCGMLCTAIALIGLLMVLARLSWNWATWFISYSTWAGALVVLGCLAVCLDYVISYLFWYRTQKKRVSVGLNVAYPAYRLRYRIRKTLLLWGAAAVMAAGGVLDLRRGNPAGVQMLLFLALAAVIWLAARLALQLLEKTAPETSRFWGRVLVVAVVLACHAGGRVLDSDGVERRFFHHTVESEGMTLYRDELPLTLADLGVAFDPVWQDCQRVQWGRAAVSYLFAMDQAGDGSGRSMLSYYVHHTQWAFLHEQYLEEYAGMMERGEPFRLDGWQGWRESDGYGLTCWLLADESTVIYLHTGLELDETQLSTAAHLLKNWGEGVS